MKRAVGSYLFRGQSGHLETVCWRMMPLTGILRIQLGRSKNGRRVGPRRFKHSLGVRLDRSQDKVQGLNKDQVASGGPGAHDPSDFWQFSYYWAIDNRP